MIIKLIQPKMQMRPMDTGLKIRMAPSLGLLTIATLLEQEHTIVLENENVEEIDYDGPADLVGITVTVDGMNRAIAIARRFQARGIPVVAGGIHITAFPEQAQQYFDVTCVGIAEKTWPAIVQDFQQGQLKKVYSCQDGVQPQDIVSPAYHLIDKRKYLYSNIVSTSRGCPFRCDFCYNSCAAYRNVYVNRNIDDVLEEIHRINKKHIMFIDDNFIGNPAWTMEFVQALKPLHIKWNAAVSANIAQMPELLDAMRESGCQSLFIGFESINAASVSDVHKVQNQVNQFDDLVEQLHKRGIMIHASFVFGLDGDDETTFARTLDWIVAHKIETVTSHILTPYPGTQVYDQLVQQGRITTFDYSLYNTAHVVFEPANMTAQQLYDGYIQIYKDIYSLKNIFKRMPDTPEQRIPYLLFNLLYRKFGKVTDGLCQWIGYERIGRLAEWLSYRL